jgi:predicted nuclease of predicted toxin-antitoxin system
VSELPAMHSRSDAEVFDLAQRSGRAVVTYDRGDFERLIRGCTRENRSHRGLVVVHPARLPNGDLSRLTAALAAFLDGPDLGPSFVVWLKPADPG